MSYESETAEQYRKYAADLRLQAEREPHDAVRKSHLKRAGEFDQIADTFGAIEQGNKNLFNALKPFLKDWREDEEFLPPSAAGETKKKPDPS